MFDWSMSPFHRVFSAYLSVTRWPAAPPSRMRERPAITRPMSTMNTPGPGSATDTGEMVSVTRIGGICWETSLPPGGAAQHTGRQSRSSKPGSAHPDISRRAS